MITVQDIAQVEQVRRMVNSSDANFVLITATQWDSMSKIAKSVEHEMTADEVERFRNVGLI